MILSFLNENVQSGSECLQWDVKDVSIHPIGLVLELFDSVHAVGDVGDNDVSFKQLTGLLEIV